MSPSRRLYRAALAIGAAALLHAPAAAPAQPAAPPDTPASSAARASEARAHYEKGLSLSQQRFWAPALAEFLLSRRLHPTWSATSAAAVCLRELQRFDEALDLFEALLREFSRVLPAATKEAAQRSVVELRALVGTLKIEQAEIGATILIDGQARGDYPLLEKLRVAAGSHVVRVIKEGFHPFERRIDVAGGETYAVEARMRAIARAGRLLVKEQSGKALDVVIRGTVVGKTPWEGQLEAGEHTIFLRGAGILGTQPISVVVPFGGTIPLTLVAEELDAALRVEPTPAGASVAIDSVVVGRGVWDGRLRAGEHKIEIAAPGFLPWVQQIAIPRSGRRVIPVSLQRDPSSLFSPKAPTRGRFLAELGSAASIVPTFGGDIAGGCVDSCDRSLGAGGYGVVRAGYELGSGLVLGIAAGYLRVSQRTEGRSTSLRALGVDAPNPGTANDRLELHGPFAGAFIGASLGEGLPLRLRLRFGAGVLLATVHDERTGAFTSSGGIAYSIGPVLEAHSAELLYFAPEVRVGLPLGRGVELSFGVELPILVCPSTPKWGPPSATDEPHPIYAGTDGYGTFGADELLSSVVLLIAPGIGARYEF